MALVQFVTLFPAWTLAMGARLPAPLVANSADMAERLRYTVSEIGSDNTKIRRITALLPGTPFIKHVNSGAEGDSNNESAKKVVRLRGGDSAELKCEVIGMPSPITYWTKAGRSLSSGATDDSPFPPSTNVVELIGNDGRPSLETAITEAKLSLNCVSADDAGVYQCIGDNGSGKVVSETELVVDGEAEGLADCQPRRIGPSPPSIFMRTDMRMEYPGNDVQLNCRATGRPTPSVSWFDSDETPIRDNGNYTVLPNGDLLVKRINFGEDKPFRQFSCRASNSHGTDTAVVGLLAMKPSDK